MALTRLRRDAGARVWFVAAAVAALPLCLDAVGDPDLWWHLRVGQWIAQNHAIPHSEMFSFTASGAPVVAHEWLADLGFWAIDTVVGLAGLAVVVGLITWSGLLALALLARERGASSIATGLVLLVGAKAMQPITGARPQMLTFALLCWCLVIVDRHRRLGGRRIWLLVPLFLLWVNLHAGFLAGLGIVTAAVIADGVDAVTARHLDRGRRRRIVTAALALALSALACLCNPNGIDVYRYALAGSTPQAHQLIQEWQRPDLTSLSMLPLLLLMAGTAASTVLSRRRLRPSHVLMAALGIAAALLAVRNIAIAVALLSPVLAELLPLRYRLPERPAVLPAVAAAAATAALVASIVGLAADASAQSLAGRFPVCLLADAQSASGPVRLWLPYGQAGFALDAAWPKVHVFAYGDDTSLGTRVMSDYVRIAAGSPGAPQLLASSGTNVVITPRDLLGSELTAEGWRQVDTVDGEVLFATPSLGGMGSPRCAGQDG